MIRNILNIKYPIIQSPMLGVTSPQMVASSCECGILGSLPLGGMSKEQTRDVIKKTKTLTDKRFAVNLFTNSSDVKYSKEDFEAMKSILTSGIPKEFQNVDIEKYSMETMKFHSYREQIDVILEEGIDIISFTFGRLDKELMGKIKKHNPKSILIGTATCLEEALILESDGVNLIHLQGWEAGGHRGSFIQGDDNTHDAIPQVGLLALVSEVLGSSCKLPLIASGAISDSQAIQSLLSMGCAGVQIGSLFICSNESLAIESYKDQMIQSNDRSTSITRSFSGRYARGIRNEFMNLIDQQKSLNILPYPVQNELTKPMRSLSQKANNHNYTNMWSGQQGYRAKKLPISTIIQSLTTNL
ncbi:hypothetical protein DLAC_00678 [Tieghemostelium lacteum]|uniref:Uncharacterized protein n=1 Tax=Tieghemostelium lacteum TaxID=361077 RepID=A0A152AAE8_TIELA|nr:hypothetical protein DLAC_00678 [Tieghemostelium lacteum]|eukprot:KYR03174.1 hypothetical protein DLAC_00678 [Tieghemostelium lacteum]